MTIYNNLHLLLNNNRRKMMLLKIGITILLIFYMAADGICYTDDRLAEIEQREYGQVFEDDSLSARLMRLETDLLGMSQSGDIDSRIDILSKLSNSYMGVNPVNYGKEEIKTNKGSAIKNFWNNITSPTYGGITGFTPAIETYGGSSGIYRNEFANFLNNSGNYCPYHNYGSSNGIFYNNNYNNGYRTNLPRHRFKSNHYRAGHPMRTGHHYHRPPYYGGSPYSNINRFPNEINTNTITRSAVKIIKD